MRRRASLLFLPCLLAAATTLALSGCQLAFDVDELAPDDPPGGDKAALGEGCGRDADCAMGLICLDLPNGYCTRACGSELDCNPMRCDWIDPMSPTKYCAISCDLGCRDGYVCNDAYICVPLETGPVCPSPNCEWVGPECLKGDMAGPCPPECCPSY